MDTREIEGGNPFMRKKVLLFDIDATLLLSGHAGTRAINRTFEELYGIQGALDHVRPDGKTDPLIFREIFEKRLPNIAPGPELPRVGKIYLAHLKNELVNSPGFRLMPGVEKLLEALSRYPDLAIGLATGNLEQGAWLKVQRADLAPYFHFGGYGSDAENRTELIRVATRRAEEYLGVPVSGEQVFVIGDTPRDILHAREAGTKTVAVSTGRTTMEELAHYEPDHLFQDLSCTEKVLKIFLQVD